ncbi:replication-relaxation family protein [Kitasatospora purpeofusca]|uniref:replication-relaxation family protein n=1 Tax=Kitasatospora purpeofusca TaxID=67352 RepID=UPI0036D34061
MTTETTNTTRATRRRARTGAEPDSEAREVEISWAVLASLFQFRIATAEQLRQLHAPDGSIEKMRGRLRRLRDEGLVVELVLPQSGRAKGWFLSEHGARIAAAFPELAEVPAPRLPGDATAFKYTLWHQLAVVRTHLAFLADARARGDGYGPFDFIPEVTHRFAEGRDGSVRPDGLLYYGVREPDGTIARLRAFVEVDRGTMGAERLASKLHTYARYWSTKTLPAGMRSGTIEAEQGGRVPLWQRRYVRFPRLLFVLTGTGQVGFDNRVDELQVHAEDRHVAKMLTAVPAAAASLEALQQYGPTGAAWYPLADRQAEPLGFHELTAAGRHN